MKYPVPQFIETEGRIISFLTFRQFFLLVGGGAFCLLLYFILPFFLFVLCALLVIAAVGMIAFVKINNESVLKVLFNFITFSSGTKTYTWNKKELSQPFKATQKNDVIYNQEMPNAKVQPSKLGDIKKIVETKK